MRIELTSLLTGKTQEIPFEGVLESEMGYIFEHLRPAEYRPIQFRGRLFKSGSCLMLECTYSGSVTVACNRCLEMFEYGYSGECAVELKKGEPMGTDETADSDEDIFWYQGSEVDLTKVIADDITINLPIQMVCKQGCSGLCPQCGKNLNVESCACDNEKVDPRMVALKELLKRM